MNNINLTDYIESKPWSPTTKITAFSKLKTVTKYSSPEELVNSLKQQGYSQYSIKTYLILAAGIDTRYAVYLKKYRLQFKNAYQTKTKLVTQDQIVKLFNYCRSVCPSTYNSVVLMARAGLRISEVLSIRWADIRNDGLMNVLGKGGKFREVPAPADLIKNSGELVCDISSSKIRNILKIFDLTPHDLRSYFIDSWVKSGVLSINEIKELAGHTSILTTERYMRANMFDIANKMKELK